MNKSTDHLEPIALPSDPRQQFLPSPEIRLLDRYELQDDLTESLKHTKKHAHLAERVSHCHRYFRHWRCDQGHDWAEAENSCSVRICPHCASRRTAVVADRITKFCIGRPGLRYVVLAERNCLDLDKGIEHLWKSWTRLRRSVMWKKYARGCIVALEVTYNPMCECGLRQREHRIGGRAEWCDFREAAKEEQLDPWHPHLNVLIEGEYFPFEALNQAWEKATDERGQTSRIEAADAGTVRELIKYVTKIADFVHDPAVLDEFLTVIEAKRLIRTYGTFFGLAVEDLPSDGRCPDCGPDKHPAIVDLGSISPQQVELDFRGVLRINRPPGYSKIRRAEGWIEAMREWRDRMVKAVIDSQIHECDLAAAKDWAERRKWKQ